MTRSRTYAAGRLLAAGLLTLAAAGIVLLGATAASAATKTVTLTGTGPSPGTVVIAVGDTVTFTNGDAPGISHVVSSTKTATSTAWKYGPKTVDSATPAVTPAFTQPGTYTYNDHRDVVSSDVQGTIVVKAAATTTPTPRASANPRPSGTARPSAGPSASPGATPATSPGASPDPGLIPFGGAFPPAAGPFAGPPPPGPQVAPTLAGESPAAPGPTATALAGPPAGRGSVNSGNPQQAYGLPAALAAVGIGGAASLLVRVLLNHPAAARRGEQEGPAVSLG